MAPFDNDAGHDKILIAQREFYAALSQHHRDVQNQLEQFRNHLVMMSNTWREAMERANDRQEKALHKHELEDNERFKALNDKIGATSRLVFIGVGVVSSVLIILQILTYLKTLIAIGGAHGG